MTTRHHFPSNNCTRQAMRDAYVETSAVYQQLFGELPDTRFWPDAGSTCGSSYSGLVSQEMAVAMQESRQQKALAA